ncbi:TIGR04283 family arsenosugar biosynthesis glycosyltransferase [Subsaxibacter sp. CAU 1640]|uniref:TIGR04283 family arsenosugar biosynthesis glycosyltransferase n=1 Tax=Subsaxibacter sp. CAU 1640 TaxID=2933271 RepID=UPI002003BE80|nr:TIGR04283 family arsenosugar biosynthesis glycosyltransferase [Subsaxibacter sp. CAU 1640]MCK7589015.1 TIGR04283 family arsenosugar biosynthesis glycosyltransferase [Subsaxibacter sp. CAU 1640]
MISIIVPILNESEGIAKLLTHLTDNSSRKNISEIIVVDGGSTDNSKEIVESFENVKLLISEKGRAKQMNLGAKHSTGTILYFLHADSFPPKNFDALIINEVNKGNNAGCFKMKFDSKHWWLCSVGWLTRFNWRACRGGDQSQFITKELFEEIGGYDENYVIYEDNILINELYNRKQFVVIPETIQTSARLYKKHGVWKLQYHFGMIYFKRWQGANSDELFAYYKKHLC